ncbi:MAG: hypothetical protein WD995_01855, partial [Gemmatimonadota bacterium]
APPPDARPSRTTVHANPTLREHVRARAENRPGVYRMFGPDGQLLYVGKSVRVRNRLLSYFRAARGEKAWELAREMKQIQTAQPRFNVQHKRKKIYSFVKITHEAAEILLVARWFKLNPDERRRTLTPEAWLRDHGPGSP